MKFCGNTIILFYTSILLADGTYSLRNEQTLKSEFDLVQFRLNNLECHNKFRELHGAPHLVQNKTLNDAAQKYAETLASNNIFKHSNGPDGENLHWSMNVNINGYNACEDWYSEIKDYDFSKINPDNFSKVGHFTQLVWKSTRKLGIGVARSDDGGIYIVAKYSPPGNYLGRFQDNVLKIK